jgi:purine-binding chemotaxis protein CheW
MGMMEKFDVPAKLNAAIAQAMPHEYLSFRLGSEEQPTKIANAPAFIKGVVNLRGAIVPIVDLRLKFDLEQAEYNAFTVVIILNVVNRVVGVVVDSVSDVLKLTQEQIRPAPEFGGAVDAGFITGLASVAERMLILMDIEQLVRSSEMGLCNPQATTSRAGADEQGRC